METRNIQHEADLDGLQHEAILLKLISREELALYTSSKNSREEQATVLREAIRSKLNPLTVCPESELELSWGNGKGLDASRGFCRTVATLRTLKVCVPYDRMQVNTALA